MRFFLFFSVLLLCLSNAHALQCSSSGKKYEISECKNGLLCIKNNVGNIVLEEESEPVEKAQCVDANFDGELDVVITHPPSGQVQMSSVYIFNASASKYEKNNELSALPCLEIDSQKKTISGTCFSSSVCEHWTERYTYQDSGLELSSMEGTYCDPATGDAYNYSETYKNGKTIRRIVKKIKGK